MGDGSSDVRCFERRGIAVFFLGALRPLLFPNASTTKYVWKQWKASLFSVLFSLASVSAGPAFFCPKTALWCGRAKCAEGRDCADLRRGLREGELACPQRRFLKSAMRRIFGGRVVRHARTRRNPHLQQSALRKVRLIKQLC